MKRLHYSALAIIALAWSGCSLLDSIGGRRLKPEYCADHPADPDCRKDFPDADNSCHSNASCMAPTAICDLSGSKACVQCVASDQVSACTGASPVCGDNHVCRGCGSHADCPLSNACLPDGSCATVAQVAYVDPATGTGNACSLAAPCKKVSDALATARPYVKLKGTIDEAVTINNQNVTVLADPGAKLTRTNPGVILKVDGTSTVEIVDLAIADGLGGTGIGISLLPGNMASLTLLRSTVSNNAGGGISASGGTLTVTQSTISGNTGGGISISGGQFDLTNNFIVSNGGPLAVFGGAKIDGIATGTGAHRLDFNTITANQTSGTLTAGVLCSAIAVPLTFASNIVFRNGSGMQVEGSGCAWNYSDIGQVITGTADINADPLFVNVSQGDFHIQATSPAKDTADPGAMENVDFDGDARPQGTHSDMGADEVK